MNEDENRKHLTLLSPWSQYFTAAPQQDVLFDFRQREMNCAGGDRNAVWPR
jgi:hypothetical protein